MTYYTEETKNKVDNQDADPVRSMMGAVGWEGFLLIAQLVYHRNPEAEIADVFEFIRTHILSGQERHVNGPW